MYSIHSASCVVSVCHFRGKAYQRSSFVLRYCCGSPGALFAATLYAMPPKASDECFLFRLPASKFASHKCQWLFAATRQGVAWTPTAKAWLHCDNRQQLGTPTQNSQFCWQTEKQLWLIVGPRWLFPARRKSRKSPWLTRKPTMPT